jgi:phosphoserine / homoserine phosphotransferase
MIVACLDLEGVLVPEIWIQVAENTGIEALRRTTRDEPDYDKLMRYRLDLLDEHGIGIRELQKAVEASDPLPGAVEFLDWLRERFPLLILSDTFFDLAAPLVRKLGSPAVFCHQLEVEPEGRVVGYRLRMPDQKRASVRALQGLRFAVIAAGDSYNDTAMLGAAEAGILFRPPENVVAEFPQFPVTQTYDELRAAFESARAALGE